LLDHLERRLTEQRGALAGIHFLHHQALAQQLLRESEGPREGAPSRLPIELLPIEIDAELLQPLLAPRLRGLDLALARYLARQPSALGALLATFRDLRDAGFTTSRGALPRSLSRRA